MGTIPETQVDLIVKTCRPPECSFRRYLYAVSEAGTNFIRDYYEYDYEDSNRGDAVHNVFQNHDTFVAIDGNDAALLLSNLDDRDLVIRFVHV